MDDLSLFSNSQESDDGRNDLRTVQTHNNIDLT